MIKKLILFMFVSSLLFSSCELTSKIPDIIAGKWTHTTDDDFNDKMLELTADGKYRITDYSTLPETVKNGVYTYNYQTYHITEASGVIVLDGGANYNFVFQGSAKEGRQFLSMKNGSGRIEVYAYSGEVQSW